MLGPQAIPARHPVHGRCSRAWSDLAVIAYDFCGGGDDGACAPHVAEGLIVAKNPLFSTYRQGENRVTSSMLAVFERIDRSLLETMLAAASGESSLGDRVLHQPAAREGTLGPGRPNLGEFFLPLRGQDQP